MNKSTKHPERRLRLVTDEVAEEIIAADQAKAAEQAAREIMTRRIAESQAAKIAQREAAKAAEEAAIAEEVAAMQAPAPAQSRHIEVEQAPSKPSAVTFRRRRLGVGAVAATVLLGGGAAVKYGENAWDTMKENVSTSFHANNPGSIPTDPTKVDYIRILPGENATTTASALSDDSKERSALVQEISGQNDVGGILKAGQVVRVDKSLVDHIPADMFVDMSQQATPENQ